MTELFHAFCPGAIRAEVAFDGPINRKCYLQQRVAIQAEKANDRTSPDLAITQYTELSLSLWMTGLAFNC